MKRRRARLRRVASSERVYRWYVALFFLVAVVVTVYAWPRIRNIGVWPLDDWVWLATTGALLVGAAFLPAAAVWLERRRRRRRRIGSVSWKLPKQKNGLVWLNGRAGRTRWDASGSAEGRGGDAEAAPDLPPEVMDELLRNMSGEIVANLDPEEVVVVGPDALGEEAEGAAAGLVVVMDDLPPVLEETLAALRAAGDAARQGPVIVRHPGGPARRLLEGDASLRELIRQGRVIYARRGSSSP